MLWRGRRESGNVSDRRGFSGGGIAIGGGIVGVIIYLLNLFLNGGDLTQLTNLPNQNNAQLSPTEQAADDERAAFVKVVLAETEDVWHQIFKEQGIEYVEPKLVLFRDVVESGCGNASAASGPFYCPADQQVYIDLSFYEELQQRFQVAGDFPMAYVIAHEVGHHVQNLLGVSAQMAEKRQQLSEEEYNRFSVMTELQADFYAGLWAHYAHRMDTILEEGDIEEALSAANAIGDDMLQKKATGRVVPDAFTHGTSAQRMYWFKKGWVTGDIRQGNTFRDNSLTSLGQ
ncbi:MAG: zinc metallopeptidase [Bacteroidetes bacterium]|nr:zinc metallopeptidase [Bacteroidota bacterium]